MIDVRCVRCGTVYHAEEAHAGKVLRCVNSSCGDLVVVPRTGRFHGEIIAASHSRAMSRVDSSFWTFWARKPRRWIVLGLIALLVTAAAVIANLRFAPSHLFESAESRHGARSPLGVPLDGAEMKARSQFAVSSSQVGEANLGVVPDAKASINQHEPDIFDVVAAQQAKSKLARNAKQSSERVKKTNASSVADAARFASPHLSGDTLAGRAVMNGKGELVIKNQTDQDAVFLLIEDTTGSLMSKKFVAARGQTAFEGIEVGVYEVRETNGKYWNDDSDTFLVDAKYGQYNRPVEFSEFTERTDSEQTLHYKKVELTLYNAPGAPSNLSLIDRRQFWTFGKGVDVR
jgi:hypothetical protein